MPPHCFLMGVAMISLEELQNLCSDRLEDAKLLYKEGRFDGAYYVCGYAVELKLKKQICLTLGWEGYPESKNEFEHLSSFKTHNLDILLRLSGVEMRLKRNMDFDWSTVSSWKPEARYSWGSQTEQSAQEMIKASEEVLEKL